MYRSFKNTLIELDTDTDKNNTTGTLEVYGKKAGTTYPQIRDKYHQVTQLKVQVEDTELILSDTKITLNKGETKDIQILDYYGSIKLVNSNKPNIKAYRVRKTNGTYVIRLRAQEKESAIITVVDAEENPWVVEVNGGSKEAQFKSFFLLDDESKEGTQNVVAFNVIGSYTEVGIEYKDKSGVVVREIIDYNEDGFYIVQPDTTTCNTCHLSFQPYIRDASGDTIYPNGMGNYVSLGDVDTFKNITIVDNGVGVASSEEIIQINSDNNIWQDTREFSEDFSITFMLHITLILGEIQNLDISEDMLNKFMYGDGSKLYYGNNHWITQEVKASTWYRDKRHQAKGEFSQYSNLNIESFYEVDKSNNYDGNIDQESRNMYYLYDTVNTTRSRDFRYAIGKLDWNINVQKRNDGYYMITSLDDKYDFKCTYDRDWKVNMLNCWGEHMQNQGLGKPYKWDMEIEEKIY